jgi:SAM-dependent methyltransferase
VRDANFVDPRLAALYDSMNPRSGDTEFYLRQTAARGEAQRVVDVGCGTGLLALLLAERGHRVTGIDPARAMLDVARENDVDGRVEWLDGDGRSFPTTDTFDLAVMTGHVFQVFLDDDAVAAVLQEIRDHLRPGGTLMFETRNPAARAWESWVPGVSRRSFTAGDGSEVVVEHQLLGVDGELVSFATTHELVATGETLRSEATLRFIGPEALLAHLDAAGFGPVTVYGDWDESPLTPQSPEVILLARASMYSATTSARVW